MMSLRLHVLCLDPCFLGFGLRLLPNQILGWAWLVNEAFQSIPYLRHFLHVLLLLQTSIPIDFNPFATLQLLPFLIPVQDLFSMGVTALGPRKKIVHALSELRKRSNNTAEIRNDACRDATDETSRPAVNKLITDFFPGSVGRRRKDCTSSSEQREVERSHTNAGRKQKVVRKNIMHKKLRDIPQWCQVPGTTFRVVSCFSPSIVLPFNCLVVIAIKTAFMILCLTKCACLPLRSAKADRSAGLLIGPYFSYTLVFQRLSSGSLTPLSSWTLSPLFLFCLLISYLASIINVPGIMINNGMSLNQ